MYLSLQKQNRWIACCFFAHLNTVVTQMWKTDEYFCLIQVVVWSGCVLWETGISPATLWTHWFWCVHPLFTESMERYLMMFGWWQRENPKDYVFERLCEQGVHPQVGAKRGWELPTSCEGPGNEECKSLFCTARDQHSRFWQGRVLPSLFHTSAASCHVDKADMSRKI